MKKFCKNYENLIFYFFIVFFIFVFLGSVFVTYSLISLKLFSLLLSFFGAISFVLIVYGICRKKYKVDVFDYFILALSFFAILSCVFAIDPSVALFGKNNRYEGLLVIVTYYLLFLLARNLVDKEKIKRIIYLFLGLGIFGVYFGFLQTVSGNDNLFNIPRSWMYASGFVGNSNFFGTYTLIGALLSIGLFLTKNKWNLLFVIIYIWGVCLSGAMSCILALFLLFVLGFVYLIFSKQLKVYFKHYFILVLVFVFCFVVANFSSSGSVFGDVKEVASQVSVGVTEGVDDKFGTNRIYIWKKTLELVPNHLLNGVGIDNFRIAFHPPLRALTDGLIVDKAHNEYLQKLFTEGLLCFIVYMMFLLFVFIEGIKKVKDPFYIGIFLMFLGYAIQAFFNISVTRVAPIYFVFIGILCNKKRNVRRLEK